jgi:hypothetical protein
MARTYTTKINDNEYIGDSLITINTNFENLDTKYFTLVSLLTSLDTTSLGTLQTSLKSLSSLLTL